jgi:hypothetical protein
MLPVSLDCPFLIRYLRLYFNDNCVGFLLHLFIYYLIGNKLVVVSEAHFLLPNTTDYIDLFRFCWSLVRCLHKAMFGSSLLPVVCPTRFNIHLFSTLMHTEGAIKNLQSRETGNIGNTKRRKKKKPHNTICVGHHYTQTNTNHVNKTGDLLQTTGGKDEPNIALCKHRTKDQQKRKRSI